MRVETPRRVALAMGVKRLINLNHVKDSSVKGMVWLCCSRHPIVVS